MFCEFFFLLLTVDPPKITQHPESKSVATGASTTLTFEASGDDLHYQWKKDGKDLHDGSKQGRGGIEWRLVGVYITHMPLRTP